MKIGPKIHTIVLDVDDVLNTWTHFIATQIFGVRAGRVDQWYSPRHGYDVVAAVSAVLDRPPMSDDEFWNQIPSTLWEDIPKSEECDDIFYQVFLRVDVENVVLATSATLDDHSLGYKVKWIRKNLPKCLHRNWSITPVKWFNASPGTLLIDDRESNCKNFIERGGDAIIWPRPWNSVGWWADPMCYLRDQFDRRRFIHDV